MKYRNFVAILLCGLFSLAGLRVLAADGASTDETTLNHLQQIGQASLIYAAENRGFFPTAFGQLVSKLRKPEAFLDARDFLQIAAEINLRPRITVFSLDHANDALAAVKNDSIDGAAVIVP